jgi:hypothetical protein
MIVTEVLPAAFCKLGSFYLWGWSGTKSTITAAIYWPIVSALDDRR